MEEKIIVTSEYQELRIDRFLSDYFPDISRASIQKMIQNEDILVNQKKVKTSYKLVTDDILEITFKEPEEPEILPENIPLDILYEDSDVIVVNKPKGMVVHPDQVHHSGTLVNGLLFHCRDLSGINGIIRPGIVHRIDMNTTGSVIACKNDKAHLSIASQLKEHSVTRRYQAIVHGCLKEEEGVVHAPIGRHPVDRKKMAVNYKNGKDAVTHFKVLKRYQYFTHIECRLETGRTHQIRVHMASIGHPILGDDVYGPSKCPYSICVGQTLHAGILGFIQPTTGEYIETLAPLPDYFQKLLDIIPQ